MREAFICESYLFTPACLAPYSNFFDVTKMSIGGIEAMNSAASLEAVR